MSKSKGSEGNNQKLEEALSPKRHMRSLSRGHKKAILQQQLFFRLLSCAHVSVCLKKNLTRQWRGPTKVSLQVSHSPTFRRPNNEETKIKLQSLGWRRGDCTRSVSPCIASIGPRDDRDGRFVRTSSSGAKVEFDSRDAFAQTIEAETLEHVFVAHVRALDNWEQTGFQSVRVDTLDAVKAHYLRHYRNPETQHLLRSLYVGLIGASVFASVGFPVALCMATQFLADRFQLNLGSSLLAQVFATTSLAVTYLSHRAQKNLSKVPAENSLRPRDQSIDATISNIQEPVIENVKESNSAPQLGHSQAAIRVTRLKYCLGSA